MIIALIIFVGQGDSTVVEPLPQGIIIRTPSPNPSLQHLNGPHTERDSNDAQVFSRRICINEYSEGLPWIVFMEYIDSFREFPASYSFSKSLIHYL